ncbi:MAG: FtsW/RodA/SpoVE family cell cycle protein [Erysipelotrichaceae bacterium]|nr:FtsW/RodA/SpoVE family cell cycle protein [Erysipelotrichaceae bacterium]MBQ1522295.1 FtsW/RodA/SpoVE family cell cycle protein [Erysipelotrichaceae bacterium]
MSQNNTRKVRKRMKTDIMITICLVFLTLFGTVMIASASITSRSNATQVVISSVIRQLIYVAAGFFVYLFMIKTFSLEKASKRIILELMGVGGLLLAARLFGNIGGAYAWISLGPLSFQPSEIAKVFIVLTIAIFMCDKRATNVKKASTLVFYPLFVLFVFGFIIIVIQSDFGSGFAFMAIGGICFLIPSNKLYRGWQIAIIVIVIVIFVATSLLMTEGFRNFLTSDVLREFMRNNKFLGKIFNKVAYQFYRFLSAGNPLWDRFGYSQELLNSLLGMSRGNIYGVGLGNSIQKFGYLASASADYIFPVIVEELGLIGIACVFVPYFIIYFILIKYSLKVKTEKEKVLLMGTCAYLFVHMFLNIGGVTAFIPLTGVPLLLISRGGTSMICTLAIMGISQNVIRKYNSRIEDENNKW